MMKLILLITRLLFFRIQWTLHSCYERITWIFDGTDKLIQDAKDIRNYKSSARLSSVRKYFFFDPWLSHNNPKNLITSHKQFVHPEYVLKDEVSLYCVTDSEALFVEAPLGVEVWRNRYSCFHRIAQHEYAVNIISMPLSSFYRLASELGEIKEKIIFVDVLPRSGSTLVGQIFEETEICVNYSEADIFMNYMQYIDSANFPKLLQTIIRLLTKPRSCRTEAFVFKNPPFGWSLAPMLHDLFPDAYFFHLSRNVIPNVKSWYKISLSMPLPRLFVSLFNLPVVGPILSRMRIEERKLDLNCYKEATKGTRGDTFYYIWSKVHQLYIERQKTASFTMPVLKYEDLISNKKGNVEIMFQYCNMDLNLVAKGLRAFDKDSQRGSVLAQDMVKSINPVVATEPEVLKIAQQINDYFNLGHIQQDFRFEGTITKP